MATFAYGPYYQSAIQAKEKQRKALTGQGYTPEELAGLNYGELTARYAAAESARTREEATSLSEQQLAQQKEYQTGQLSLGQQGLDIQKKAQKSEEKAATMSGIGQLAGAGTALIPAIGGIVGGIGAAAAGAGLAAGGATVAGTATMGGFSAIGYLLGGLLGCCFTFLEGEMLTKNVRRYRDEHYDKFTSSISFGYRWMSTWLVPFMRIFKIVKFMVKFFMLKPLSSYADWYYGENKFGWIFYPVKVFWTNFWRVIGLIIKSLVNIGNKGIREEVF